MQPAQVKARNTPYAQTLSGALPGGSDFATLQIQRRVLSRVDVGQGTWISGIEFSYISYRYCDSVYLTAQRAGNV